MSHETRSTNPAKDEILDLLEKKKDVLTIVEGTWDKKALQAFGFSSVIMCERLPFYKVVELVDKGQRVQILTDLDEHGRGIYSRLNSDLRQRGAHVDNELRELLFRTKLRQIEGLPGFLSRLE